MVGLTPEDRPRAVELFGENDLRELVGQGRGAETNDPCSGPPHVLGQAAGPTHDQDEPSHARLRVLSDERRPARGIQGIAAGIEGYEPVRRPRVGEPQEPLTLVGDRGLVVPRPLDLPALDRAIPRDPTEIFLDRLARPGRAEPVDRKDLQLQA